MRPCSHAGAWERGLQLGGLIGEVSLAGPALAVLWPALWFGQWTHVGQGTAFGLGGYRTRAAPKCARRRPALNSAAPERTAATLRRRRRTSAPLRHCLKTKNLIFK